MNTINPSGFLGAHVCLAQECSLVCDATHLEIKGESHTISSTEAEPAFEKNSASIQNVKKKKRKKKAAF